MKIFKTVTFTAIFVLSGFIAVKAQTSYVHFTSPVTGTKWEQGSSQTITWTSEPGASALMTLTKINRDVSWQFHIIVEDINTADGSFTFNVASNEAIGDKYYLLASTGGWDDESMGKSDDFSIIAGATPVMEIEKTGTNLEVYPNPFSGTANISFSIESASMVQLRVMDMNGKEVAPAINKYYNAGHHQLAFESGELPKGLYICHFNYGTGYIRKIMSHTD